MCRSKAATITAANAATITCRKRALSACIILDPSWGQRSANFLALQRPFHIEKWSLCGAAIYPAINNSSGSGLSKRPANPFAGRSSSAVSPHGDRNRVVSPRVGPGSRRSLSLNNRKRRPSAAPTEQGLPYLMDECRVMASGGEHSLAIIISTLAPSSCHRKQASPGANNKFVHSVTDYSSAARHGHSQVIQWRRLQLPFGLIRDCFARTSGPAARSGKYR